MEGPKGSRRSPRRRPPRRGEEKHRAEGWARSLRALRECRRRRRGRGDSEGSSGTRSRTPMGRSPSRNGFSLQRRGRGSRSASRTRGECWGVSLSPVQTPSRCQQRCPQKSLPPKTPLKSPPRKNPPRVRMTMTVRRSCLHFQSLLQRRQRQLRLSRHRLRWMRSMRKIQLTSRIEPHSRTPAQNTAASSSPRQRRPAPVRIRRRFRRSS
mmetsp:Transcript_26534/g.64117  ORF Transcript_26534/g.64117 Transcript_26534/m.64117 type:complete len:210 (-) Transcript_26534:342-971(-)